MSKPIFSEKKLQLLTTGQGLFETMLFHENRLWFYERHERRLLAGLGVFNARYDGAPLRRLIDQAIRDEAGTVKSRVKLIILFPFNYTPKQLTEEDALVQIGPEPDQAAALSLKTIVSPFNPEYALLKLKTINYGYRFQMQALARRDSFDDALYMDGQGFVSESGMANFFAFRGERIITPPLCAGVLPGIIREILLEQAGVIEEPLHCSNLAELDGAFLTNSLREIHFVNKIDSVNFKPVTERGNKLLEQWKKIKDRFRRGEG
jgi:branched-subunit amino acid aminotransferase/4-amino-4-deoxychorismate lyase